MLGPGRIVGNPLDAGFAAVVDPSVYMQSIKIMIDDPDTDIVIIDAELPKAPHELRERNLRIVNDMAGAASKPVVYISAMSIGFTEFTKGLRKSLPNIAVMQGLDRAVGAIKSLIEYASLAQGGAGYRIELQRFRARDAGEDAEERQRRRARRGRVERSCSRPTAFRSRRKRSRRAAAEAVKIAKKIGFPVVAKVVSAEILHKSDIGGVVLNLNSAAEVKKAFNDITARVKKLKGKPKLEGILIAQQVKAELELVVGASLDAEMGPVVLFGTGGVDIELMKDVALAGAPLDAAEAKQLIDRTKAGVKLKGYRGKPALHEASAVKALVGLSNLMADAGNRIASIDVNPFLINTKTGVAVDAPDRAQQRRRQERGRALMASARRRQFSVAARRSATLSFASALLPTGKGRLARAGGTGYEAVASADETSSARRMPPQASRHAPTADFINIGARPKVAGFSRVQSLAKTSRTG